MADVPQHLSALSDILGPDVDLATLEKLHVISNGDLNRAINHFYEGSYHTVTNPGVPAISSTISTSKAPKIVSANGGLGSIYRDDQPRISIVGAKRKAQDSFFPKYFGELTVIAYALGGMVKIEAGEEVLFDRKRPNSQVQHGRKKKGLGSVSIGWGRTAKENHVVRFTKQNGFEIGRLQVDTSRWVSKLMDYKLAEFRGTIILAPPQLRTGAEIVLTMRCYLTAEAFSSLGSNQKLTLKSKSGQPVFVNEAQETEDEVDLKQKKYAVNALFRELALTPVATNTSVGPRDRGIDIHDGSTTEGSLAASNGEDNENEQEPEVSDKELDVLYEKAQQHGRAFEPMDPPKTMTYTLKPYQRVALAWMYNKEVLETASDNHKALHPLWEEYEFKKEDGYEPKLDEPKKYYFNPYSGEMSLEFPTSDKLCRGGILADEMGLGKTIEILSLVHSNPMNKSSIDTPEEAFSRLSTSTSASNSTSTDKQSSPTTLVVCPMSLLSQWRDEAINSSDGSLSVEVYYGAARGWTDSSLQQKGAPDILITSYGTVLSEFSSLLNNSGADTSKSLTNMLDIKAQNNWKKGSALFNVEFHRVVLDEAHHIKSRMTQTAKACYALNSPRRWVVTGTPIQNKLEDLFSLVHFLRAEPWSNFSFWRTFITIPFESKDKDKALKVVTSVLEPLVLRRTKMTKDENGNPIITLPERIVEIEYLKFSEQENDIYQALFKDGKTKFNHYCRAGTVLKHYASIFQLLMRMRQVCDHPMLVLNNRTKQTEGKDSSELALDMKDGPIQLEELMKKFSSGEGDNSEQTFGASVLQNLVSSTGEVTECPICYEELADGVLMPCMHSACRSCILDYLQRLDNKGEMGECPICRKGPITEDSLIEYTTLSVSDSIPSDAKEEEEKRSGFVAGNVLDAGAETNGGRVVQIRRNNFKSSAKLEALMKHLNELRKTEPKTKSVVFSQFTGMLDLVEKILERDGFQFLRLDGSHSHVAREQTLQAFRTVDHPARVMLISLRAGGVGLNLTTASRVFMLDPWWNYAIEAQAIDRVHRIGQLKPVIVKRFIIENSVEEKILSIQNRKNALASGLGMTKLEAQGARMEDLQEIFS
ncbi:SNF2 family N-terminal domain-domain-containing protein [Lobosporangium transversale]|uniref:SNF2 family N-terminal domain-domain-containing protein n=1 Tax=Lobosporangium transversale TaxID=64571 RepID=A0A1Y2G7Z2_9FUNG|nr:SNF2 family N-terminal domain-domain-containing protein [Lobosporangium transversale]ORZ01965.1 SNF2 family N-terminal domain-domain-containing protein [Lobosporangium transversale]|eukprot:XP_021876218.1 SNF2 family N-terminal domain-domain-containing protein [Lobosporangium transversale]